MLNLEIEVYVLTYIQVNLEIYCLLIQEDMYKYNTVLYSMQCQSCWREPYMVFGGKLADSIFPTILPHLCITLLAVLAWLREEMQALFCCHSHSTHTSTSMNS